MDKLLSYVKDSNLELAKVIFPDKASIKSAFISVSIVVTFMIIFLALADFILSLIMSMII